MAQTGVRLSFGALALSGALLAGCCCGGRKSQVISPVGPPLVRSEFIFETAPFPSCHASTIAETKDGLVAAWFGGKHEKNPDVAIWVSRHDGQRWSALTEVANGVQGDKSRVPCWNPVLFQPANGPLLLFYKVGPSPSKWWGMMITSDDGGKTWSAPRRLPDGILGPIKDKPVALADGTLLCPSSTENDGWRVHIERTSNLGLTWAKSEPLNTGKDFGAIQPTLLFHSQNKLQLLCRTKQNVIGECWSEDGGKTWGVMKATSLPNPNSGIDAVTLRDGRHLLVYNPTKQGPKDRTPLVVAVSVDGKEWQTVVTLEDRPGEYSYPAIIQTRDGLAHITYTWKRQRVRHAVVDPSQFSGPRPVFYLERSNSRRKEYAWQKDLTFMRALAIAGGFTIPPDSDSWQITRVNGELENVSLKKARSKDPLIQPGDTIVEVRTIWKSGQKP